MKSMKPWDELTIRDNYLFKKVLSLNDDLCRRLLERLLGIVIARMDAVRTEMELEADYLTKSVRLDVYAEDDRGRVYDIEMQATDMPDDELFLRTRYYQAMIDQGLLEKGQPCGSLRESYIIFVCAFDPFGLGLRRYSFRGRCDERPELALPDRAVRIFLNTVETLGDEPEDVRGFLNYVNTDTADGVFAAEFAGAVKSFKESSKERGIYMSLAMEVQQHIEREKGNWLAEGRAEGEARKAANIASKLLQRGIPAEQVAEDTGLAIEEVRKLRLEQ